jgi:hypothetical protein
VGIYGDQSAFITELSPHFLPTLVNIPSYGHLFFLEIKITAHAVIFIRKEGLIPLVYSVLTKVRMHFAHRTLRTFRPFSITVTDCRLGRKVRWVAFLDHGRFLPKVVFLPQCAHFAIT